MTEWFVELRKGAAKGTDSLAADAMRHLHTRQHLGKAVVVCDQPIAMLSAARKQWLKLSRFLQKQRAGTLNADKILKYTHAITRMQRMAFSAKSPLDNPEADVYFLPPDKLTVMPVQCWTTYLLTPLEPSLASSLLSQLPQNALLVDYLQTNTWTEPGVQPKAILESRVEAAWRQASKLLQEYQIDLAGLVSGRPHAVEAMDDALDILLGLTYRFLETATAFQRALEQARPLRLSRERRAQYDAFILLAHRVQALSPGAFGHHFLETYNEDDTFFLYDAHRQLQIGENLVKTILRHESAGRHRLASALRGHLIASTKAKLITAM
jgi:hypothetical protein